MYRGFESSLRYPMPKAFEVEFLLSSSFDDYFQGYKGQVSIVDAEVALQLQKHRIVKILREVKLPERDIEEASTACGFEPDDYMPLAGVEVKAQELRFMTAPSPFGPAFGKAHYAHRRVMSRYLNDNITQPA